MTANTQKDNGTGDKLVDSSVIIAAILLYAKTADVLSFFSPQILNDILGFDVGFIYGLVTAALVEGIALALHFNRKAKNYTPAKIVKWLLLGISGFCQVYDGFITTDTVNTMSDPLKVGLSYGVPLIPLFIVILIFFMGSLPEDDRANVGFKGLKNMLPDLKRIWEGDVPFEPISNNKNQENKTDTPFSKEDGRSNVLKPNGENAEASFFEQGQGK